MGQWYLKSNRKGSKKRLEGPGINGPKPKIRQIFRIGFFSFKKSFFIKRLYPLQQSTLVHFSQLFSKLIQVMYRCFSSSITSFEYIASFSYERSCSDIFLGLKNLVFSVIFLKNRECLVSFARSWRISFRSQQ